MKSGSIFETDGIPRMSEALHRLCSNFSDPRPEALRAEDIQALQDEDSPE